MFKQRRVPAKARRKTYAWSGDGVGADYDEDEPEERHRASDRVGFDGWRYPEPEPAPEPPSKLHCSIFVNTSFFDRSTLPVCSCRWFLKFRLAKGTGGVLGGL